MAESHINRPRSELYLQEKVLKPLLLLELCKDNNSQKCHLFPVKIISNNLDKEIHKWYINHLEGDS